MRSDRGKKIAIDTHLCSLRSRGAVRGGTLNKPSHRGWSCKKCERIMIHVSRPSHTACSSRSSTAAAGRRSSHRRCYGHNQGGARKFMTMLPTFRSHGAAHSSNKPGVAPTGKRKRCRLPITLRTKYPLNKSLSVTTNLFQNRVKSDVNCQLSTPLGPRWHSLSRTEHGQPGGPSLEK